VMSCISTVSFSFLISRKVIALFTSSRGVQQGDPLSSYVFLLGFEGCLLFFAWARTERKLTGLRINRGAPKILHLLFAGQCTRSEDT